MNQQQESIKTTHSREVDFNKPVFSAWLNELQLRESRNKVLVERECAVS